MFSIRSLLISLALINLMGCAHYQDSQGQDYYYPPLLYGSVGPVDCASGTCPPQAAGIAANPQARGVVITQGTINGRGYTHVRAAR